MNLDTQKMEEKMNNRGVSVPELLIVILIIAVLAGMFFIGYSGARKRIDIDNAANSIATTLMDLRLSSMTTDKLRGFMAGKGCGPGRDCYATFTFDDKNGNYKIEQGEQIDITYFNLPQSFKLEYTPPGTPFTIFFDKRGLPRDENGDFAQKTLKIVLTVGAKKMERTVEVSMRIAIKK